MKWPRAQTLLAVFCLGLTILFCHVSQRLHEFSAYSLDFVSEGPQGPEPASFRQLLRSSAYLDTPGGSGNACLYNLRQMDGAKQQWAIEHGFTLTNDTPVTWQNIEPYIKHGPSGKLWCPRGGRYTIGKIAHAPTCSIKTHKLP